MAADDQELEAARERVRRIMRFTTLQALTLTTARLTVELEDDHSLMNPAMPSEDQHLDVMHELARLLGMCTAQMSRDQGKDPFAVLRELTADVQRRGVEHVEWEQSKPGERHHDHEVLLDHVSRVLLGAPLHDLRAAYLRQRPPEPEASDAGV